MKVEGWKEEPPFSNSNSWREREPFPPPMSPFGSRRSSFDGIDVRQARIVATHSPASWRYDPAEEESDTPTLAALQGHPRLSRFEQPAVLSAERLFSKQHPVRHGFKVPSERDEVASNAFIISIDFVWRSVRKFIWEKSKYMQIKSNYRILFIFKA